MNTFRLCVKWLWLKLQALYEPLTEFWHRNCHLSYLIYQKKKTQIVASITTKREKPYFSKGKNLRLIITRQNIELLTCLQQDKSYWLNKRLVVGSFTLHIYLTSKTKYYERLEVVINMTFTNTSTVPFIWNMQDIFTIEVITSVLFMCCISPMKGVVSIYWATLLTLKYSLLHLANWINRKVFYILKLQNY